MSAKTATQATRSREAKAIPIVPLAGLGICVLLVVALLISGGLFILVLAACVLGLSLYAIWRMIAALAGDIEEENEGGFLAIKRRRDLIAAKETALKVYQELEFDRQLGRISEEDYKLLAGPVKKAALEASLRVEEEQKSYRDAIEAELARRLRAEGLSASPPDKVEASAAPEPRTKGNKKSSRRKEQAAPAAKAQVATTDCPSCEKAIDADSLFCKYCGHRFAAKDSHEA